MKMPVTDADLHLIFQYLDDELSDGEEQALLQRMQENTELQQAFDQQILMSAYLSENGETQTTGAAFESADDFVNRINSTINNPAEPKRVLLPGAKKRWQPLAAAAAVVAIIFIALLYFSGKRNTGPGTVVKTLERTIPATKDSTTLFPDTSRQLADVVPPEKLYLAYARPLADDDMQLPAAAEPYQSEYQQGRFTALTRTGESTVITKGERPAGEEQAIINYFNFYKALSFIATKQPAKAKKLLQALLTKSRGNKPLSNHAAWYLLLLSLQSGNQPEALQLAAQIATDRNSRYQTRATEIQMQLGGR